MTNAIIQIMIAVTIGTIALITKMITEKRMLEKVTKFDETFLEDKLSSLKLQVMYGKIEEKDANNLLDEELNIKHERKIKKAAEMTLIAVIIHLTMGLIYIAIN